MGMSLPEDNVQNTLLAERVFDGRRWHRQTAVLIDHGRVRALASWADVPRDSRQKPLPADVFLAPGFIDLQVNGGGGVLLNDDPSPDAMRAIASAHRRFGTTALLPTLITDSRGTMERALTAAHATAGQDGVLGLHLEGPFLNRARAGVHRADKIARAELRDLEWLCVLGQAGCSLITLAPECVPPGFIRGLVQSGLRVSVGHSEASADIVDRAVEEGATGVTHLFNGMPAFKGRAPGIVGMTFAERRLVASLIVDGLHVDPVSVRAVFAAKGADGVALVTDAMPTIGSDAKAFNLLGQSITLVNGRLVTLEGTLAGAHLDMATAVRNTVTLCGIPLADALTAATLTPARLLGIEQERGALVPGARADLVALNDALDVLAVWVAGSEVQR